MAPGGLAAAKNIAATLSITTWLLYGGFLAAAIGMFFPWVTVSADVPMMGHLYEDVSPFKDYKMFAVLAVIAAAAWLAWPTLSASRTLPANRLIALTAVVGLLAIGFVIGVLDYVNGVAEIDKQFAGENADIAELRNIIDVSIGFGFILYTAGLAAIIFGVVRLWRQRPRTQTQAY